MTQKPALFYQQKLSLLKMMLVIGVEQNYQYKTVVQNNQMQKIISQIPELQKFLSGVSKKDQVSTIKHILRLGLQTLRPPSGKQNHNNPSNIVAEIDLIKQNLQELNQRVKSQCNHCNCSNQQRYQALPNGRKQSPFKDNRQGYADNSNKSFSFEPPRGTIRKEESPFRQTALKGKKADAQNQTNYNPFSKNKQVQRNLDDTQVRQALRFPPSMMTQKHPPLKRNSHDYKKHIYQQQINKEEISKLKEERPDSQDHYKRDRFVSDYTHTSSKIKKLLDQDRIRYYQRQKEEQFKEGFNKYQYSDENQMEEESSIHQSAPQVESSKNVQDSNTYNQHFQSSLKESSHKSEKNKQKTSEKKEYERSKQSKKEVSKLEGSLGEQTSKYKTHSKESSHGGSNMINPTSEKISDKYERAALEEEEDDDVISNSSSFSQFSISQSRKRNVGKISRRSNND